MKLLLISAIAILWTIILRRDVETVNYVAVCIVWMIDVVYVVYSTAHYNLHM
jgi:hypothetical protein